MCAFIAFGYSLIIHESLQTGYLVGALLSLLLLGYLFYALFKPDKF